jgi:hypothetical protein
MAVNMMETVGMLTLALNRMGRNGSVKLMGASGQALANLSQMRCLLISEQGQAKPMVQRSGNQPVSRLVDKPHGLHAGRRGCESASISTRERFPAFAPGATLGRSAWTYHAWTIGVGSVATYAR